jgi:hypothetical protein
MSTGDNHMNISIDVSIIPAFVNSWFSQTHGVEIN